MATNGDEDEPIRRWPRAWRLIFLLTAAALCWAGVLFVLWLALGHRR